MQNNPVARNFGMQTSQAAIDEPLRAPTPHAGPRAIEPSEGLTERLVRAVTRLSDKQLALVISVGLLVLGAWPVALTDVPPMQDLPNHLAAVTVISHPERYPEFVFNGFLKTNAALFTWLYFVGKVTGVKMAARLFTLLVIAGNALVFPAFVLQMSRKAEGSRRQKLLVASLFAVPMMHNWYVSMGMLDFAMSVPLGLGLLMALDRQGEEPSWRRGLLVTGLGLLTWYAHVFTLLVVHMVVLIHLVTRAKWSERVEQAKRMVLPLLPLTLLVLVSLYKHMTEVQGAMAGYVSYTQLLPAWELAYNLWAEWLYGFTWLSISSFVPAVVLTVLCFHYRNREVPLLSKWALLAMLSLYIFAPYIATNWFHVNSRLIPFLWVGALVRVPDRLPRWLVGLLALSAVLYSVGMGVDYVRLDRDRAKFTAGIDAVPEGAKLLPLLFTRQLTAENTRSLQHAWGFYVLEKETSAPLLFAHSRSFPVMYREPPPTRFNHLVLEGFAPRMRTSEPMCSMNRGLLGVVMNDCEAAWRNAWKEFWDDTIPRYDHVLMWDPSPEAQALVPPAYRVSFHEDRLTIYERVDTVATP